MHVQTLGTHAPHGMAQQGGSRTIEEQVNAILVGQGLQDDAHLLPLLVGAIRRVPCICK